MSEKEVKSIDDLQIGDHIKWNGTIEHHAIIKEITKNTNGTYITLIHYMVTADKSRVLAQSVSGSSGTSDSTEIGQIILSTRSFTELMNEKVIVLQYNDRFNREKVVERAMGRLGERAYNLLFNNCESFVRWCTTDENISYQVVKAAATAATGALKLGSSLSSK